MPEGTVASGEVRGGAPATREWALLDPQRTVDRVDAVLLCGRSAFGLAAADGAALWLEERGRGFETPAGRVPIVVAAALYDLPVGDASVRPGPGEGRIACDDARAEAAGARRGGDRGRRRPGGGGRARADGGRHGGAGRKGGRRAEARRPRQRVRARGRAVGGRDRRAERVRRRQGRHGGAGAATGR